MKTPSFSTYRVAVTYWYLYTNTIAVDMAKRPYVERQYDVENTLKYDRRFT